jgi:hypothetical protein
MTTITGICTWAGTGKGRLEQCQEKHVPDADPGWKPVFRPTLRQGKQLDQSSIPRNRTLI